MINHYIGMLSDTYRIESFRQAIAEMVQPDDVVVEVGSGVGTYALFAAQSGARKVYAIEKGGIGALLPRIIADNGLDERIEVLQQSADQVQLPERADVLITEDFCHDFLSSDTPSLISSPRDRLLKSGGRILPQEIEVRVAPVSCAPEARALDPWLEPAFGYGLDFSALRRKARAEQGQLDLQPADLLAPAQTMCRTDPLLHEAADVSGHYSFEIERAATLGGLACWFEAQLSPSVRLTNGPGGQSTVWRQAWLFLPQVEVGPGDRVEVELAFLRDASREGFWKWEGRVLHAGSSTSFADSTFAALCLTPELLQAWSLEGPVPASDALAMDRYLLNRLADAVSLETVVEDFVAAFPQAFPDTGAARAHVARVVRRYV